MGGYVRGVGVEVGEAGLGGKKIKNRGRFVDSNSKLYSDHLLASVPRTGAPWTSTTFASVQEAHRKNTHTCMRARAHTGYWPRSRGRNIKRMLTRSLISDFLLSAERIMKGIQ